MQASIIHLGAPRPRRLLPPPIVLGRRERWCLRCGETTLDDGACPRCASTDLVDPRAVLRPDEYVLL